MAADILEKILAVKREEVAAGKALKSLAAMRAEHTDHGAQLDRLRALTHDLTPPPGACNTWRALYSGLVAFTDDLVEHIHLENNRLFPAFEPQACCT